MGSGVRSPHSPCYTRSVMEREPVRVEYAMYDKVMTHRPGKNGLTVAPPQDEIDRRLARLRPLWVTNDPRCGQPMMAFQTPEDQKYGFAGNFFACETCQDVIWGIVSWPNTIVPTMYDAPLSPN